MTTARKLVCITGVTRGLGAALAHEFVRMGYWVWGCGRDQAALDDLSAVYEKGHSFTRVDVTCSCEVEQWAARCLKEHGSPDLLINNAGVINSNDVLWRIDADAFGRVMEVNVMGTFNTLRAFLPHMIARGSGTIVNLSSQAGRTGIPLIAPYCASKHAVEGLTKALAAELPDGLSVVALDPGGIDTAMLRSHQGSRSVLSEAPEEWVGRAAAFIASLDASVNGESLEVPPAPDCGIRSWSDAARDIGTAVPQRIS